MPHDATEGQRFGDAVSAFANTALVATPQDKPNGIESGSAYVFRRSGNGWTERLKLVPSDGQALDLFGESVSLHANTALVGANLDDNENGQSAGAA